MKHSLLIPALAASLLFSNHINAKVPGADMVPKLTLGIKAGVNMQTLTGTSSWKSDYNAGFVGGAFVGVTKNKIGVEGEVLVKSAKFNTNSTPSVSINTVSLDIPVLFEYKIVSRLWVQVGPQFTTMISAKQSSTDVKKNFNSSDFSGVLGLQVNLPLRLTVGARYILGMTNINNESVSGTKESWNNRSIQIYVGFRFI